MAKAKISTAKPVKIKEQRSIFDAMENIVADFVIDNCKFDTSKKNWCKNWDGKGNIADVKNAMKCPVNEDNFEKCKFFVVGFPCKNFRGKK